MKCIHIILQLILCKLIWLERSLSSKALVAEVKFNQAMNISWKSHLTSGVFPKNSQLLICILDDLKHKHSPEWNWFCPLLSTGSTGDALLLNTMFLWLSIHSQYFISHFHSVLIPPVTALYCYECVLVTCMWTVHPGLLPCWARSSVL